MGIYQSPYEMKGYFPTMALLLLLLVLCFSNVDRASAANYYFSATTGDDSRTSEEARNPETPWQTLSKLNEIFSRLEPGDSILFRRNDHFFGNITITRAGTENAPIVLGAYGTGYKPVITGFVRALEWTAAGNGVYESEVLSTGATVNMVVINGVNFAKGRFPNADAPNGGYLDIESTGNKSITNSKDPDATDWKGAQMVMRTSHWTLERRSVTSRSGKTLYYDSNTAYKPEPGFGYFIQGHPKTLDQYGEWYYNPNTRKISVFFGEDGPGENVSVLVSAEDVLISPRANHIVIDGLTLEGANKYGVFYEGYGMDDLQIYNSDIRFSGIDAVSIIGWSHFVMEDCRVENSNNCGIRLEGQDPYSTIRNNTILNTGMQAGMGGDGDGQYAALFTSSRGLVAEYNTIVNTGYVGIRFAFEDVLVKNNFINYFCMVMDDGAGIYTYDSRGSGSAAYDRKVIGNIVLNGLGAPEGTPSTHGAAEGIYLDDNSYNIEVTGNTVANCGSRGIFIHNAGDFMLSRNTIFNNGMQLSTVHDQYGNPITGAVITDNIFFSKDPAQPAAHLKSSSKDFGDIGKFDRNYYARPLDDSLTIAVEYQTAEGARVLQPFTLKDWQDSYGKDANSRRSPLRIQPYQLDHENGKNQVPNGHFTENEVGTWCWSPSTECLTSWQPTSIIGDGVLQVKGRGPSFLGMDCGSMTAGKYYVLRFTAAASQEGNIEIFLQQSSWPWERMTLSRAVKISTAPGNYELLFSVPVAESAASLQFGFDDQGFTYWLDNIEFFEVDARMTNPDSHIRFEYNAEKTVKTLSLTDSYIDVTGQSYSGSLELQPFSSVVLLRDVAAADRPDEDPDTDPTADPNGGTDPNGNEDPAPDSSNGAEPDPDTDPNPGIGEGASEDPNTDPTADPNGGTDPKGNEDPAPDSSNGAEPDPDTDPNPGIGEGASEDPDQETDSNPDPEPESPGSQTSHVRLGHEDLPLHSTGKPKWETMGNRQGLPGGSPGEDWKLYPNPLSRAASELTVEYHAPIGGPMMMMVVDQYGRQIQQLRPEAEKGWNRLKVDSSRLPAGTYFLYVPNVLPPMKNSYRFVVIGN